MLLATLSHILPVLETNMAARLAGLSTFKTGVRYVQANSGGNLVVWVPQRDTFEPGRQQAGVRRVTRVRVANSQAYLWGVPTKADGTIYKRGETIDVNAGGRNSIGQVEAMLNALLCALEDSCKSVQYDVADGEWEDQTGDGVSEYGLGYFLPFTIRIPVVYDPLVKTHVSTDSIGFINADTSITTPPP